MSAYAVADVARLVGLDEAHIRAFTRAGFVGPSYAFSDLVLLKTAKRLLDEGLSQKRIEKALGALKSQLKSGERLSGVAIAHSGRRLVAARGDERWDPESGQVLLALEGGAELGAELAPLANSTSDKPPSIESLSASEWIELGRDLELEAPMQARDAYRRALELSPENKAVRLRLAELLEKTGQPEAAAAQRKLAAKI